MGRQDDEENSYRLVCVIIADWLAYRTTACENSRPGAQ